jgi:hypothetical protein
VNPKLFPNKFAAADRLRWRLSSNVKVPGVIPELAFRFSVKNSDPREEVGIIATLILAF